MFLAGVRHVQIAGQRMIERGDVGAALDRGVAAQRQDAAAGPADVAEQHLQHAGGADDLHAHRVLRPADRVDDGGGPFSIGVRDQRLGDLCECLFGAAADALDHLGRVARVVPLQDLEDGIGILERGIFFRTARNELRKFIRIVGDGLAGVDVDRIPLVAPGRRVVSLRGVVPAGKEAVEIVRSLVVLVDEQSPRWCSWSRTGDGRNRARMAR